MAVACGPPCSSGAAASTAAFDASILALCCRPCASDALPLVVACPTFSLDVASVALPLCEQRLRHARLVDSSRKAADAREDASSSAKEAKKAAKFWPAPQGRWFASRQVILRGGVRAACSRCGVSSSQGLVPVCVCSTSPLTKTGPSAEKVHFRSWTKCTMQALACHRWRLSCTAPRSRSALRCRRSAL